MACCSPIARRSFRWRKSRWRRGDRCSRKITRWSLRGASGLCTFSGINIWFPPKTIRRRTAIRVSGLFRSFWMAGFECSTHINHAGHRLDMTAGVQHDSQAETDYALLRTEAMQTARDGLRWHLVDHGHGVYDFSSFTPMLRAALKQKIQVLWDLCHYGWPDDLDLFSPAFVDRFAKFSAAVARHVREHTDEVPFYAPVNEISFFSWAAARGVMFPYAEGRDTEIKRQLVRAVAASIEAIRDVDPRARFVYPEPTICVVPAAGHPEQRHAAAAYSNSQFEAWDMIAD